MTRRPRHAATALIAGLVIVAATGCDKVKGMLGGGSADGGAEPSGGGGGIFSFLGNDFEGEITATITMRTGPQAQQLVFGIKKPRYRIDFAGGAPAAVPALGSPGSVIIDPPTKKGWVLVPAQKTAMVVDFDRAQATPGAPNARPKTPPTIDKTGKKDVVAGYSCEVWKVTFEGKRAEACVAEGITWFDLTDLGMASPELAVAAFATEANRFPLRLVSFDPSGAEEMRMEATNVDKKKLDDARFVVPPDYRVVDMAALMGGLLGPKGLPSALVPPPAPKRR